jgi:hypothetical protein
MVIVVVVVMGVLVVATVVVLVGVVVVLVIVVLLVELAVALCVDRQIMSFQTVLKLLQLEVIAVLNALLLTSFLSVKLLSMMKSSLMMTSELHSKVTLLLTVMSTMTTSKLMLTNRIFVRLVC